MRKAIKFRVMKHTLTAFGEILHIYIFLSRKEMDLKIFILLCFCVIDRG